MSVGLDWSIFQRTTFGVRELPCPFQHCCFNFSPDIRGNCIANFEDLLECFVDVDNMVDKDLEGLFCPVCGADASRYITIYENPDDPQECVYECSRCKVHSLYLDGKEER